MNLHFNNKKQHLVILPDIVIGDDLNDDKKTKQSSVTRLNTFIKKFNTKYVLPELSEPAIAKANAGSEVSK